VPEALADLIRRLLKINPEHRPRPAAALKELQAIRESMTAVGPIPKWDMSQTEKTEPAGSPLLDVTRSGEKQRATDPEVTAPREPFAPSKSSETPLRGDVTADGQVTRPERIRRAPASTRPPILRLAAVTLGAAALGVAGLYLAQGQGRTTRPMTIAGPRKAEALVTRVAELRGTLATRAPAARAPLEELTARLAAAGSDEDREAVAKALDAWEREYAPGKTSAP
jgi:hypothetical protein